MHTFIRSKNIVRFDDNEQLEIIDGFIAIEGQNIAYVEKGEIPKPLLAKAPLVFDVRDKTVTAGLIDAHTHLVHAGSRENELGMKLAGLGYLDILKNGGGILSTVEKTRKATKQELKDKARKSLDIMIAHGTTTVEAKSGYGLDFDTEIKCLKVLAELNEEHEIDIVPTYMGAHAVPTEYKANPSEYISLMCDKVMPYVAQNGLAEFVDVFCEHDVFSVDETRAILKRGRELGLKLKIHADEIVSLGGAELAAELGATSAEHLLASSEQGIQKMAQSGVVAVVLPGTSFYLMTQKFAQARQMIQSGVRVAIATDYNPGSCPTENLQAIMPFAAFGMKLTPAEILKGMTLNAAHAICRQDTIGNIKAGMKADLVIFDAPNLDYIVYHFGINHVEMVFKNGTLMNVEEE